MLFSSWPNLKLKDNVFLHVDEGAEDDELSFRQGDIFEKLEEKDEQGWCKGRRNGQVGLIPAEYIEGV